MVDSTPALTLSHYPFLADLGLEDLNLGVYHSGHWTASGAEYTALNPHDNKPIAKIKMATSEDYENCIKAMEGEKERWMLLPMPQRGEIVR